MTKLASKETVARGEADILSTLDRLGVNREGLVIKGRRNQNGDVTYTLSGPTALVASVALESREAFLTGPGLRRGEYVVGIRSSLLLEELIASA